MLNNKGFAVSTVLYVLLIAFLMFLGVALAQFSSSSSLIGKANDDIINGTEFKVIQKQPIKDGVVCGSAWNSTNTIVQIKSRYGTKYWPKDFKGAKASVTSLGFLGSIKDIRPGDPNGNIEVEYNDPPSTTVDYANFGELVFKDKLTRSTKKVILVDICK